MSRLFRCAAAALACCVVGLSVSQAQERPARAGTMRAKSVLGSRVTIKGGAGVGTVGDIIFSPDGQIEYLAVLEGGRYRLVPWEAARFDYGARVATLTVPPERYREVPTFAPTAWPDVYDSAYRQKLYGYYGLKPRPFRPVRVPPRP